MLVNGTVTEELVGLKFKCTVIYGGSLQKEVTEVFPPLRVLPVNMALSVLGDGRVIEGKKFSFGCRSVNGIPAPVHKYSVVRGVFVVSNTNSYTPIVDDRGKLILQCADTSHPFWRDQSALFTSVPVNPIYIAHQLKVHKDVELYSKRAHQLLCNVTGYPYVNYEWTCTGCRFTGKHPNMAIIPPGSIALSSVKCKATVRWSGEVTVTWSIKWNGIPQAVFTITGWAIGLIAICSFFTVIFYYHEKRRAEFVDLSTLEMPAAESQMFQRASIGGDSIMLGTRRNRITSVMSGFAEFTNHHNGTDTGRKWLHRLPSEEAT